MNKSDPQFLIRSGSYRDDLLTIGRLYGEERDRAAYLPHSCDEWVISMGSNEEIIAGLREMEEGIAAAIKYLEEEEAQ